MSKKEPYQEYKNIKEKNKKITDERIAALKDISFLKLETKKIRRSVIIEFEKNEQKKVQDLKKIVKEKIKSHGGKIESKKGDYKVVSRIEQFHWPVMCSNWDLGRAVNWRNVNLPDSPLMSDYEMLATELLKKLNGLDNLLEKDIAGREKGEKGEDRIIESLKMYQNKYTIMDNILLPASGIGRESSETDMYIITPKGVCVCEIKNYGDKSETLKISKDGMWSIVKTNGKRQKERIKEDSPVEQNASHCLATEQWLEKNGIHNVKMIPIIFIANNEVKVENESANAVMRASELYNYLNSLNLPDALTVEEQKRICAVLRKGNEQVEERLFDAFELSPCSKKFEHYIKELFALEEDEYNWCKAVHDTYKMKIEKKEAASKQAADTIRFVVAVISIIIVGVPAVYFFKHQGIDNLWDILDLFLIEIIPLNVALWLIDKVC